MREPSTETKLRTALRENARLRRELHEASTDAKLLSQRCIALQTDRDEWKARFDALLARVPLREPEGE